LEHVRFASIEGFLALETLRSTLAHAPTSIFDLADLVSKASPKMVSVIEAECIAILDQSEVITDKLANLLARDNLSAIEREQYERCEGECERGLWRYVFNRSFFTLVERTDRLRNFRDFAKLYSAFGLTAPKDFEETAFSTETLAAKLALDLNLTEGCDVAVWRDPPDEGGSDRYLFAITTAGQFTSVRTYKKGSGAVALTYLPAREIVLSYAASTGVIEVCSEDRILRQRIAEVFATDVLGVDLSKDPLTWKTYSLWPLRQSLTMEVPDRLRETVRATSVVEVGMTMGTHGETLTLRILPKSDLEELSSRLFAAAKGVPGAGRITHAKFHVEYRKASGKDSSFGLTVSGRNSCSIANQRDPERRRLGAILLEEWKILERFRDLRPDDTAQEIRALLGILDHGPGEIERDALDAAGADVPLLLRSALIKRKGLEDIVLIETDDGPVQAAEMGGTSADGQTDLEAVPGVAVSRIPAAFAEYFTADLDRIVQKVAAFLAPLGRSGRIEKDNTCLWRIGNVLVDGKPVPAWLAAGLDLPSRCAAVDRHLREMPNLVNGIVFAAGEAPFLSLATHPVVSIPRCLASDGMTTTIDAVAVAQSYVRSITLAKSGEAVVFRKWSAGLAQLIVPGQLPLLVDSIARVQVVENLYKAFIAGAPGLSVAATMVGTNMTAPQPVFGKDWPSIKGRYIDNRTRGLWAIVTGPDPTKN
jgi:hypothetical protein